MKIHPATINDATEACAVIRQSITELCYLDHGGDEDLLATWLSNKTLENVSKWILQSHFFVAEDAGRIVGVAAMAGSGEITLNYVSLHARFRGVSKALMLSIEDHARALGIAECSLETTQTALRFYRSLGYVQSEQNLCPTAHGVACYRSFETGSVVIERRLPQNNGVLSVADWVAVAYRRTFPILTNN